MPKRIQLKRSKGWRKPEGAIVVSRPTKWGNPYQGDSNVGIDRARLARLYDEMMQRPEKADFLAEVRRDLRGKDLACWCPLDEPCHADVLIRLANLP